MQYKTQMEAAKKGIITEQMRIVAEKEYMEPEKLRELVACGQVAIPANIGHKSCLLYTSKRRPEWTAASR